MKNLFYTIALFFCIHSAHNTSSQTILPFIEWQNEFSIPSDANTFMDYTDDACMLGWAGSGAGANLASLNADGMTNFLVTDLSDPNWELAEICNSGITSYAYLHNTVTNEIQLSLCNNEVFEILHSHTISIPAQYSNIEIVSADMNTTSFERHSLLLRVFDTIDSKWKVLVIIVNIDLLGDTATHEIIAILIGLYHTFPSSVLCTNENIVFVSGYFNKNASGSNHDLFISKINADNELIYSRTHASYVGKNDMPKCGFVIDSLQDLYLISESQDNVSPFNNHIAVIKINSANGKKVWIKRLGEATAGSEICYDAAGNLSGDGIAITGSISDGSTGRNGRTWRLNGAGNTIWFKSINELPAGSIEESRTVGFCPITGDVNIAGYLDSNFFATRYNATSGAIVWGPESFEGDLESSVAHQQMHIDFSILGKILIAFIDSCYPDCNYLNVIQIGQDALKQPFQDSEKTFTIFPNPSNDYIQIEGLLNETIMKIINLNGEIVLEKIIQLENNRVEIENLPSGFYTIYFYSNEQTQTTSFIKSN